LCIGNLSIIWVDEDVGPRPVERRSWENVMRKLSNDIGYSRLRLRACPLMHAPTDDLPSPFTSLFVFG